jgi:hypothetical protein
MKARVKSTPKELSVSRRDFLKGSVLTAALPALPVGAATPRVAGIRGSNATSDADSYDVVVYGGTASGVLAAIAATSEGARVVLLEPGKHVGGMVSGGLSRTDMERQEHLIGGLAGEFFTRVARHYNRSWSPASGNPDDWTFEPHVAEDTFNSWLKEAGTTVRLEHRVETVEKQGNRIANLKVENGIEIKGKVFIDASYEGDLMARSGVSYVVGREGRVEFGEPFAGRRETAMFDDEQIQVPVPAYDDEGHLLPLMSHGDPGVPGEADHKIQEYNYRVCLTSRKDNQVPFAPPANYDPNRYILAGLIWQGMHQRGMKPDFPLSPLPNDKYDANTPWGGIGTNFTGESWSYPDADYKRRQEIWDAHLNYIKGFYYFLANDPSVPQPWRDEIRKYGLPKDEFLDTDHWPHQLYVREGRRMRGEYVMKQSDLQDNRTKFDSIGMGGYNMDILNVQRIPVLVTYFPTGTKYIAMNEGYMSVPVEPYQIPYRALLPLYAECTNLLVPVCVSATHVAYGSLRIESQYMLMGHAAGVAAAMAARDGCAVHQVGIQALQDKLRRQRQILATDQLSPVINLKRMRD